jgi:aryl-alcohol dehydrogenase-like predicted oxidoreductase
MKQVPLGDSGVSVSEMCLGCMYFGTATDEATSFALLDQYVEAGGSFLDTANIYAHWVEGFSGGESERLLGKWMKERGNREQMFVATKVGFHVPGRVPDSLAPDIIRQECELSLQNLQTATIDLYYAHTDDRSTPLEDTLLAFAKLVEEGKVRYIACSNTLAWRIEKARCLGEINDWPKYVAVQQRHTYIRPKYGADTGPQVVANEDLLDYCRNEPVALVAYSTLLGGVYARPDHTIPDNYQPSEYDTPDTENRLAVLKEVAEETGATMNQVVLAWMMQGSPTTIPLVASGKAKNLAESFGALEVKLSEAQIGRLTEANG